jgi:hypothetical protein
MPSQNQQYSNAMAISRQVCVLAPRHQAHGADDSCCLHKIISAGSSLITAAAIAAILSR